MSETPTRYADPNRISIVVPVYNAEKYVGKLIRSIRKQTYKNWHLILVNDGSKDGSASVLDKFAAADDRITVIHQANQGSVSARGAGLFSEPCRQNQWVIFADADDVLPKRALEKLFEPTKDPEVDLVCGPMNRLIWNRLSSVGYQYPCFRIKAPETYDRGRILNELLIGFYGRSCMPASLCAKLFRTEQVIEAYNNRLPVRFFGDDLSISIQVVAKAKRLVLIPDTVYGYRPGGGTSRFMPDMMNDCLLLYAFKKQIAASNPMPSSYRYYMDVEMMNNIITWIGGCIYKGGWDADAVRAELERLRALPEIREAAAYVLMTARSLTGPGPGLAQKLMSADTEEIRAYIDSVWQSWHKVTWKTYVRKLFF